ncbi:NblA/ycf18 family protein [Leptothoe spongobia]|uniref:NblA/ycf18 family protein n=1 Tax=Leptothoe spongobia TAU-MAC 1115 TaxID=1967444 RepID=A0A947DH18_9CYAN|nr:NblA/ycf18 family protein [Leptothoe spongobia]MBT9316620.1 NblA/ycf18 family protein [Leptothoe spongobia TAU-MAC 1115]
MDNATELILEQEFNLRNFEDQVQQMNLEQAQEYLVKLYQLMLVQKRVFQELMKREWNLNVDLASL